MKKGKPISAPRPKFGSTNADPDVVLRRFPRRGIANMLRCEMWEKYSFPDGPWCSQEFQKKLYAEHRMLASNLSRKHHFTSNKLHEHACPRKECDKPSTENLTEQSNPVAPGSSAVLMDITNTVPSTSTKSSQF